MAEMITQDDDPKISPEALEVANCYMTTLSIAATAKALDLPPEEITSYVNKKEVQQYINTIFLDQGYMNKFKLQSTLDNIIEKKLEEMEESELYSNKDIADLILLAHKMRMEELKHIREMDNKIGKQINVQQNNYSNHNDLIERIIKGE